MSFWTSRMSRRSVLAGVSLAVLAACGGGDDDESGDQPSATSGTGLMTGTEATNTESNGAATTDTGTNGAATTGADTVVETPVSMLTLPTPTTGPVTLTAEERLTLRPNEVGLIPVMMYHHIDTPEAQFVRTIEDFRADLQWLYDHNFSIISLGQMLSGDIDIPAGRHPVVLTFDDSPVTNFRLLPVDGAWAIDPNCAVGILEEFSTTHPEFGRGGHFAILGSMLFDWTPDTYEGDQAPLAADKIRWLADNGYEIGNHTYNHANLAESDDETIMAELAMNSDAINAIIPGHPMNRMDIVTLPYGAYPHEGDDTIFRGFTWEGRQYVYSAALLVGANPSVSSFSTTWDPYAIARIQAFDDEIAKWFPVMADNPGILYASDGNPATVTVPNELEGGLVGTFDALKVGEREVIRY